MKNKKKFVVGDKVKVLEGCGFTLKKGDIGIITEEYFDTKNQYCRVTVENKENIANIAHSVNLELIKGFKLPNKTKRMLLEDLDVFEVLSIPQLITIIWWDIFNQRKINIFFNNLDKGRSVRSSFEDASK